MMSWFTGFVGNGLLFAAIVAAVVYGGYIAYRRNLFARIGFPHKEEKS